MVCKDIFETEQEGFQDMMQEFTEYVVIFLYVLIVILVVYVLILVFPIVRASIMMKRKPSRTADEPVGILRKW